MVIKTITYIFGKANKCVICVMSKSHVYLYYTFKNDITPVIRTCEIFERFNI